MTHRIIITFAALLAAGLAPTSSTAAESDPGPTQQTPATSPTNPADIHITSATWQFIPGVETLDTTGFITTPQAQSLLNQNAQQLLDCYHPTNYQTDGTMTVQLYIGPTGIPVGVRGDTDGIAPLQARCMLKQTWLYEFTAPPNNEQQASLKYRIFFPTERTYTSPLIPNRPNMIIENVRTFPENNPANIPTPELTQQLTQQLLERSNDLRSCQIIALKELPNDLLVSDVKIRFQKFGTIYRAADLDITLTNQTSTTMPSNTLLECIRQNIAHWQITLPPSPTENITTRFFITFQPPQ